MSSTLYIILEILMYNKIMYIKKIFCIVVFSITILFSLSAQSDDHREDLQDLWMWNCVGNEDNSIFLISATEEESWRSYVYYFVCGKFMTDVKIHTLWDKSYAAGTIRHLVFSPFSKKFYFTSAWSLENDPEKETQGLWIASQTGNSEAQPLMLSHQKMEQGIGYLAVNKKGVWLLKDYLSPVSNTLKNSKLYKIEDEKGNFIFSAVSSADNLPFHAMEFFMNKEKKINKKVKYEYEQIWQFTDYTLLICDEDESSWWVFNCLTEKLKKYDSLELAKKATQKIDRAYATKQKVLEQMLLISVLVVILVIFAVVLILVFKKIRGGQKAASRIEHNKMIFDIQEKERAKISRDIHDSVVQDIRVLRLETENLVVDDSSKARQTKIEDLATDCIIKLRNICYNLTPAELVSHNEGDSTQLELISIINSLVQQFSARTHIPCVFKVEEGFEYPVLEKESTQNLFRVIQEALTNIEKHSYATQASIFIKKADSSGGSKRALLIYITDDGIGCNQNELAKKLKSKEHLGLRGMKDRMELIGGQIEFFTAQNDGMEIKIELPLESAK